MKKIKKGVQYRALDEELSIDQEKRTVKLAFSSETPVARYDGNEILDHAPSSIRLGRLKNGAPVLIDHNPGDQVGVVESVSIDADRKGRAVVRFGKSERATEIFNDIVDGIRKSVSVGYRVYKAITETDDSYRVTDWQPLEISIVSIPADEYVGIGRGDDGENEFIVENKTMTEEVRQEAALKKQVSEQPKVDVDAIRAQAIKEEQQRISEITEMGRKLNMKELADKAVKDGKSVNEFNARAIQVLANQEKNDMKDEEIKINERSAEIGLTEKEVKKFSLVRAINALANPTDKRAQEMAAFEFEASQAAASKSGRTARGIMIPEEVLKRDLVVGTTTAGGHTVSTDLLSGSFIDILRNRMMVNQMGATTLSGLVGNIAIPRQTGGATAYWVAESGAPTESQQAFDQVTLSPNTVGAFTDISRKLMLQSSIDVESFVQRDLATTLALAIDLAAINGSGSSNQPLGIIGTSGIGSVAGGTNGLAPDLSHIIDLETQVAIDNADIGTLGYLTNAKVRGKLKQTFTNATYGDASIWNGDSMNGYRAGVSNQVPSTLDKGTSTGVCSAIIFGNWADLLIGLWGGLDLVVDPYTASTSGTVRVVALQDVDVAVRHPESFAAMLDALTA